MQGKHGSLYGLDAPDERGLDMLGECGLERGALCGRSSGSGALGEHGTVHASWMLKTENEPVLCLCHCFLV